MKSGINFLLCALLLLSVVACKDDDDVKPGTLPGTWRLTDIHSENGTLSFDFLGTPVNGTYEFHGLDYNATTTFTENPNVFTSQGSYTAEFTTNVLGQAVVDTITASDFASSGSWSLNGDKLTQIFNGDTSVIDILELSGSKLRVKLDQNQTYEDGGIIYTETGTIFSTFEKQ